MTAHKLRTFKVKRSSEFRFVLFLLFLQTACLTSQQKHSRRGRHLLLCWQRPYKYSFSLVFPAQFPKSSMTQIHCLCSLLVSRYPGSLFSCFSVFMVWAILVTRRSADSASTKSASYGWGDSYRLQLNASSLDIRMHFSTPAVWRWKFGSCQRHNPGCVWDLPSWFLTISSLTGLILSLILGVFKLHGKTFESEYMFHIYISLLLLNWAHTQYLVRLNHWFCIFIHHEKDQESQCESTVWKSRSPMENGNNSSNLKYGDDLTRGSSLGGMLPKSRISCEASTVPARGSATNLSKHFRRAAPQPCHKTRGRKWGRRRKSRQMQGSQKEHV